MVTILGIDEAGRGPVIGPMVMAGVMIEAEDEDKLVKLGIRDSKDLSPKKREQLFDIIRDSYRHEIIMISPQEIDACLLAQGTNLNWLEAESAAKIISSLRPDKVILDCPSPNILAFARFITARIPEGIIVVAEHKADANYPVVGAGSILAKVTRDREIEKLKAIAGIDFGSGYPSDPRTIRFLEENYRKYDFFRTTWSSYKRIAQGKQSHLGSF